MLSAKDSFPLNLLSSPCGSRANIQEVQKGQLDSELTHRPHRKHQQTNTRGTEVPTSSRSGWTTLPRMHQTPRKCNWCAEDLDYTSQNAPGTTLLPPTPTEVQATTRSIWTTLPRIPRKTIGSLTFQVDVLGAQEVSCLHFPGCQGGKNPTVPTSVVVVRVCS